MRRLHRSVAAVAILALSFLSIAAAPPSSDRDRRLPVMSRNLYLGTDLTGILGATNLSELITAASAAWANVVATDFPARAEALADEIVAEQPVLVGLQEATLYRTGPFDLANPATDVAYDFIAILVDALAARGMHYAPLVVEEQFDGELPAITALGLQDIRLTDRDAILARTDLDDSDLLVSNPQSGHFTTNLVVPTPFGPIELLRGWTSVDAKVRGKSFRFVNTHLEAFHDVIQRIQGQELLAGPVVTALPVVLVGDLNSDADGTGATYNDVTGAGFTDAWTVVNPGDAGYTCCQAGDLANPTSQLDQRIDLVLFRGGFGASAATVVGDETTDMTPAGLWPSDHAGLAVTLLLPRPGMS